MKTLILTFPLLLCSFFFAAQSHAKTRYDVSIACDSLGKKKEQCVQSVKDFEKETGLHVKIVEAPTGSSNRLTWVQQQLASHSKDIDVYQIDTTWAGLLKSHLLPLNAHLTAEEKALYHPALISNNTIDGHLLALPWYVDIGLLIYRKDLLEKYGKPVPETWEDLGETARFIQEAERNAGNTDLWGYVFSGKAFEGLTCNVMEWVHSSKDQAIIAADGTVHALTPENIKTLTLLASWIGVIAPKGVLNYAEEDSRGVFQSGKAVFVRHWPYIISLAEAEESPLRGKIGVAPLPKGTAPESQVASTLGGWQLGVSAHGKNKENAIKLIKFLTSKEQLKARALRGSYYPPMPSVLDDPEVKKSLPAAEQFLKAFSNVVARPSAQTKLKYNQVSSSIWNTAHSILIGKKQADKALKVLQKKLESMSKKGKKW